MMSTAAQLYKNPKATDRFLELVMEQLHLNSLDEHYFPEGVSGASSSSAVLFLLGKKRLPGDKRPELCVILNKRSRKVRQPGDLCFPGGRVAGGADRYFARMLTLFPASLPGWPHWSHWKRNRPNQARRLALLFATSLRESFEEMRLNPMSVKFLGPMPSTSLVMFRRVIYPLVGWVRRQRIFYPNWEVEKIVAIPLEALLQKDLYACYRITFEGGERPGEADVTRDFPCFRHQMGNEREILWGATYSMITQFLEMIFEFTPPPLHDLPVVFGRINEGYYRKGG